jgi:hypothetical protein
MTQRVHRSWPFMVRGVPTQVERCETPRAQIVADHANPTIPGIEVIDLPIDQAILFQLTDELGSEAAHHMLFTGNY